VEIRFAAQACLRRRELILFAGRVPMGANALIWLALRCDAALMIDLAGGLRHRNAVDCKTALKGNAALQACAAP
jgi:hypothetical protein